MKVILAIQTLSHSTASAMEFLMEKGYKAFEGAKPTIEYIRMCADIFDVFNSKKSSQQKVGNFLDSVTDLSPSRRLNMQTNWHVDSIQLFVYSVWALFLDVYLWLKRYLCLYNQTNSKIVHKYNESFCFFIAFLLFTNFFSLVRNLYSLILWTNHKYVEYQSKLLLLWSIKENELDRFGDSYWLQSSQLQIDSIAK